MNNQLPRDSQDGLGPIDELIDGVILTVNTEMRGKPAPMVYEILDATLQRRLPGIQVDEDFKRDAAARISVGALEGLA